MKPGSRKGSSGTASAEVTGAVSRRLPRRPNRRRSNHNGGTDMQRSRSRRWIPKDPGTRDDTTDLPREVHGVKRKRQARDRRAGRRESRLRADSNVTGCADRVVSERWQRRQRVVQSCRAHTQTALKNGADRATKTCANKSARGIREASRSRGSSRHLFREDAPPMSDRRSATLLVLATPLAACRQVCLCRSADVRRERATAHPDLGAGSRRSSRAVLRSAN